MQALIDTLPDVEMITDENRADVEAWLTDIDNAKLLLTDQERDVLNFTKYNAAITALNVLDGMKGAEKPTVLDDTYTLQQKLNQGGTITLDKDYTINTTLTISDTVTLDLNGYVLKYENNVQNDSVITVQKGSKLTVKDSNPSTIHYFTVENNVWKLSENETEHTVSGGVITGGTGKSYTLLDNEPFDKNAVSGGGVFVISGGCFTLAGGNIVGCSITNNSSTHGGGVYVDGSDDNNTTTFQMSGGNIIGCTSGGEGGGIFVANNSTFTMSDGSIRHCISGINNYDWGWGGGVYASTNAHFTMTGGIIKDCHASNGGCAISGYKGTIFTMSGGTIDVCQTCSKNKQIDISAQGMTMYAHGGVVNAPVTVSCYGKIIGDPKSSEYQNGKYTVFNGEVTVTGGEITGTISYGMFYGQINGIEKNPTESKKITFLNGETQYAVEFLPQAVAPTPPTKEGYSFLGWYEKKIDLLSNTEFTFGNTITDDLTLYAKWGYETEVTYGQYTDKQISAPETTQDGYTYTYQWYNSSKKIIDNATSSTYKISNNLTAGSHNYYCVVTATPTDNTKTTAITEYKITVKVKKADAQLTAPTAKNQITYGATLNKVKLDNGWTWVDGNTVPTVNNNGYVAYYTPADVDNYDWSKVEGWNADKKCVEKTVVVTVNKAEQSAPTGLEGIAETIEGKADGKIIGVTTAMEYRKSGDTNYTKIDGIEITNLGMDKYYVRMTEDDNHKSSPETEVTINAGKKLTVNIPKKTEQIGYTLTVDKTEVEWHGQVKLSFALANGYSKSNTDFAIKVNGTKVTLDANDTYVVKDQEVDIHITVEGVVDTAAPTGEIQLGTNSWKTFLNHITFGLFFKDTQEVEITAADNSGKAVTIGYLLSDEEFTVEELAAKTFITYKDKFLVEPNNAYIIYAALTDQAGNVTYINSNGIVLDNIIPVLSGIENGKTYCEAQTVTITEEYIATVTVNGIDITKTLDENNQITLSPAQGVQKIVVTDKTGNKSEMTVTINNGHIGGTATCTEKAVCDYCGKPYGKIDKTNHVSRTELKNAKDATCTKDGYTGDTYCKGCDTKLSDGKTIAKTGHDYESKITKEATTISTGTKSYTCKNCGHSYDETIAKLPSKNTSPKSGDETPLVVTIMITLLSAMALIGLVTYKKRDKGAGK